jgi:hypothetical protein
VKLVLNVEGRWEDEQTKNKLYGMIADQADRIITRLLANTFQLE